MEQEFDQFAEEYNQLHAGVIKASGEAPQYFAAYKPADVLRHLASAGTSLKELTILDFGCGVGESLSHFRQLFPDADIIGADVSSKSLEVAARRYAGIARLVHLPAGEMNLLPDASVDVAFSACVFHHIPHAEHDRVLRQLLRIVKPGGWLFVFEHNPLNPLTLHAVNTCPFDENAELIRAGEFKRRVEEAGFSAASTRYRVFFPRVLRRLRPLELQMMWCPFGAQYYVAARRPV